MQKIVVGVDGSEESWSALDEALSQAGTRGSSITAVHVEHLSAWTTLGLGATLGDVYEADERIRAELVDEAHRRSQSTGVTIDVVTRKGRPAQELISVAEEVDADLIVVGHRGHGGAASWIGSVTNEVVHSARCSVLVVR